MEFTYFFSLSKQQLDLVTIVKGLDAVRSSIIIAMSFLNEINYDDNDDDHDDNDDDDVADEDIEPNFYRHDVGNDDSGGGLPLISILQTDLSLSITLTWN